TDDETSAFRGFEAGKEGAPPTQRSAALEMSAEATAVSGDVSALRTHRRPRPRRSPGRSSPAPRAGRPEPGYAPPPPCIATGPAPRYGSGAECIQTGCDRAPR